MPCRPGSARRPGTRQPPPWSPVTRARTLGPTSGGAWRSTPPDPTRRTTSESGRGRSDGWAGRPCRRTATTAAVDADLLLCRATRHPTWRRARCRQPTVAAWRAVAGSSARRSRVAASTTPSAVHRMPRSASTVRACQRVPTTSRWSVASSPCGVMTEYTSVVAPPTSTTRTSPPTTSASTSTPRSTASGVGARTSSAKPRPRDRPLPPMTCARNASRIAARAASGATTPMRGSTLAVTTNRRPVDDSSAATPSAASALPATTTGAATRARASRCAVVQQHVGVASVGAPDEQHEVGAVPSQRGEVAAVHRAARDVDDLRPGRQPDPVTGLGRDLALVADDGQAQASARAGAHEHPVGLAVARERGAHGIHTVHDVGRDRRRGARGAQHVTGAGVDEHALGERRADVDAEDRGHRVR